jgi:cytochrome c-type biogenesis protein CcmE
MDKKGRVLLLAALGAALAVLVGLYFFASRNMVYYWRTDELMDRVDEKGLDVVSTSQVRLGALVKEDSKQWDPVGQTLRFVATNAAAKEGQDLSNVRIVEVPVFSMGAGPAMFREGIAVVVEGYFAEPDCTAIQQEIVGAKACLGVVDPGTFHTAADRCGLSLQASRFGEACENDVFADGPAFVSEELLVKHSNEYRLPDENSEDPMSVYKTVDEI